jgi:hypothetical protein
MSNHILLKHMKKIVQTNQNRETSLNNFQILRAQEVEIFLCLLENKNKKSKKWLRLLKKIVQRHNLKKESKSINRISKSNKTNCNKISLLIKDTIKIRIKLLKNNKD